MPDIGHVAVGLLAGRLYAAKGDAKGAWRAGAAFSAVSLLPDLDLIGRGLGADDLGPLGHRGALHSLAAAALIGLAVAAFNRRAGIFAALVAASHGALDMLDVGNLGVAYLWPLTPRRFFWPWRFLPGPPPGEHWLSLDGARAVAAGSLYFLPVFAAALWPRSALQSRAPSAILKS